MGTFQTESATPGRAPKEIHQLDWGAKKHIVIITSSQKSEKLFISVDDQQIKMGDKKREKSKSLGIVSGSKVPRTLAHFHQDFGLGFKMSYVMFLLH